MRFLQLLTLVAFATMALASSSTKDTTRNIYDFIDGWEQSGGRQLNSIENADSISDILAPHLRANSSRRCRKSNHNISNRFYNLKV